MKPAKGETPVTPDDLRKLAKLCKRSIPIKLHRRSSVTTGDVGEALYQAADELELARKVVDAAEARWFAPHCDKESLEHVGEAIAAYRALGGEK